MLKMSGVDTHLKISLLFFAPCNILLKVSFNDLLWQAEAKQNENSFILFLCPACVYLEYLGTFQLWLMAWQDWGFNLFNVLK